MDCVRFPKGQLSRAKAEGNAVVVAGYDGPGGRTECVFRLLPSQGMIFWHLAIALQLRLLTERERGDIRRILDVAFERLTLEREARQAAAREASHRDPGPVDVATIDGEVA